MADPSNMDIDKTDARKGEDSSENTRQAPRSRYDPKLDPSHCGDTVDAKGDKDSDNMDAKMGRAERDFEVEDAVIKKSRYSSGSERPTSRPSLPSYVLKSQQKYDFEYQSYDMNPQKMGTAIIINNKNFEHNISERTGSDQDAKRMKELLQTLGFKTVLQLDNLTADGIKSALKKASEEDHKNSDCFVCVILSYGMDSVVCGTDGNQVSMDEITRPFKADKCTDLANKPKLFFVQACPIHIDYPEAEGESQPLSITIPTEADFLTVFSEVPGKNSWEKDTSQGSWFIQTLCEVISKNREQKDLMTMLTMVIGIVLAKEENWVEEHSEPWAKICDKKKYGVTITSLLTKELCFRK